MIVQRAFQIRPFDQFRQVVFLRRRKFAVIFAQFRRHKKQESNFAKMSSSVLRGTSNFRIARLYLRFEQAVYIQPQPALDRSLAHHDIMFLVAGKIHQRETGIPRR